LLKGPQDKSTGTAVIGWTTPGWEKKRSRNTDADDRSDSELGGRKEVHMGEEHVPYAGIIW
jgi:hypothetical protein